jgi:hypothetical protein
MPERRPDADAERKEIAYYKRGLLWACRQQRWRRERSFPGTGVQVTEYESAIRQIAYVAAEALKR